MELTVKRIVRAIHFRLIVKPREKFAKGRYQLRNDLIRLTSRIRDHSAVPSAHLMAFVTGNDDASWYVKSGKLGAQSIQDILRENALDIKEFDSILDFGCGVGRVIRYWHKLRGSQIYGTDYNQELITWCEENIKFAHFQTNQLSGPLDYEDGKFDFIYALSVFTHIKEENQIMWMNELTRVLKPGGFLLITVHGDYYLHTMQKQDRERYNRGELVVYGGEVEGSNICTVHHPDAYVLGKLAAGLTFIDHVPKGALGNPHQNVYLFQKPPIFDVIMEEN